MTLKKPGVSILFLLLFATGYSQTEKGTFALSGKTDLNFVFSNTTVWKAYFQYKSPNSFTTW